MKKLGLVSLMLTLAVLIPVLFFVTRSTVPPTQFVFIVSVVLLLVLWIIPYVTLVDPWLRRGVGALFSTKIEWRGTSKTLAWSAVPEPGCLASLLIDLLGYLFIILWFIPFAAVIALAFWIRH
jgi:hypothetical protein